MSQIKIVSFKFFILLLLCYSGCSDRNKKPTVSTIIHPENWISDHSTGYLSVKNGCTNCHGIKCDGGNVDVSCFSTSFEGQACHEQHPAGWKVFTSHGTAAQLSPDTTAYGFPKCQKCHGEDFSGGIVNVSCIYNCHGGGAPHPRAPWNDETDTTKPRAIHHHGRENPLPAGNLVICAGCHRGGKYSTKKPDISKASYETAALGCLNNTICHPGPSPSAN